MLHTETTTLDEAPATIARIPYEACPLCDSPNMVEHATADCSAHPMYDGRLDSTMRWMRCTSCTHVFTDGYWGDDALAIIFGKTHAEQTPGHDLERQRYVSARIVEKVSEFASAFEATYPPQKRLDTQKQWLDVGCGNGSLPLTAAEFGYNPIGADCRPETAQFLTQAGVKMFASALEAFNEQETRTRYAHPTMVDVVSMADLMEHLPFPAEALSKARDKLREGLGVLFLSMPNMGTAVWKDMDAKQQNPYWIEIEHYHQFTRERLYRLLRDTDFEPVWYGVSQRYRCGMEVIARPV